jgi:Gluconate 2-dehydrogenase subunit 3
LELLDGHPNFQTITKQFSTVNRRESLKKAVVLSSGLIALPAWANGWRIGDVTATTSFISIEDQALLASVADTIIPAGNSIGALAVGVDKYLLKLFADCYDQGVQSNISAQLKTLESWAQATDGKSFTVLEQSKRQALLMKMSSSEEKAQKDFFTLVKSETIRGFNTSKEVMVNYFKYKMLPGHYNGCVDVTV